MRNKANAAEYVIFFKWKREFRGHKRKEGIVLYYQQSAYRHMCLQR